MIKYLALAAVAVVLTLIFMLDRQSSISAHHPPDPVGELPAIYALGRIEGASQEVELRVRLHGRIVQILATEGQQVEKGDLLLRIDDQQYRHEVALAAANLKAEQAALARLQNGARPQERREVKSLYRAKLAELEGAQLDWHRTRDLREKQAISQQEADDQRTRLAEVSEQVEAAKARLDLVNAPAREDEVLLADAKIEAAQARLELAKVQLERTYLKAPISGQVLQQNTEVGELTGPDAEVPAIVLADTSRFRVRAFVEEIDAPRAQLGMRAVIKADGLPNKEYSGRISQLSPQMSRKQFFSDTPGERFDTKTREIWIELDEADQLVIGLRVDVLIEANEQEGVQP